MAGANGVRSVSQVSCPGLAQGSDHASAAFRPAVGQERKPVKLFGDGGENLGRSGLSGLAGATANQLDGRIAGQFGAPNARDELAGAMFVEIHGGAVGIGLDNDAGAVNTMANRLSFSENLHSCLP